MARASKASDSFRPGDVLARRYRVEGVLGSGALGVTYRARDEAAARVVALKVVGAEGASFLEQELFALRGLQHPHLARALDYVRLDAGGALASELVPGVTLDRAPIEGAPAFTRVLRDVASALAFLHGVGLVHGDVKPENVIVGQDARATLIDLSCARPVGEPDASLAGTPAWIAPERGTRPVAPTLDVYSFGASMAHVARARGVTLDAAVRDLLRRCTQKDPDERPRDGAVLAEALGVTSLRIGVQSRVRSAFFGRAELVATLDAWIAELARGLATSRARHLVGPHGAGKSRLLTAARWCAQPRMDVVEIRIADDGDPVREAVRRALGERAPASEGTADVVALAREVEALAGGPPVLFVVDDVERATPTTARHLAALRRLASGGGGAAVLSAGLARTPDAENLDVPPLGRDDVAAFLAAVAPHLDPDVVLRETGGLPGSLVAKLEAGAASGALCTHVPRVLVMPLARVVASPWPLARGVVGSAEEASALVSLGWITGDEPVRLAREDDRAGFARAEPEAIAAAHREHLARAEVAASPARLLAHRLGAGTATDEDARAVRPTEDAAPLLAAPWVRADARVAPLLGAIALAGDPREALAIAARALRRERDPGRRAALRALGARASARLGLPNAVARLRRALTVASSSERGRLAASLALALLKRGAYAEARDLAREATSEEGLEGDVARDLAATAAQAASYLGDSEDAHAWLARATATPGTPPVRVLHATAIVAYRDGDGSRALEAFEEAVLAARREGNAELFASASISLGALLHETGAWGRAREAYEDAALTALAIGMAPQRLTASFDLARLEHDIGREARALAHLERAEAAAHATGNAFMLAACAALRAEVAWLAGDDAAYDRARAEAAAGFRTQDAGRELAEVELVDARRAARRGDEREARAALVRARAELGDSVPDDLAPVFPYVEGLVGRTPADRARSLERAASLADAAGLGVLRAAILGDLAVAQEEAGLGALAADARRSARIAWERVVASLPLADRDAFFAHPDRRAFVAKAPETPDAVVGQRTSRRLREILAVNRRLVAAATTDEILEAALDAAVTLTGAEQGTVLLAATDARLEVHLARDAGGHPSNARDARYSRSIARRVLSTGEALVSLDVEHDARLARTRSIHALGLRSVLAVPIRSASEILGVLGVHTRSTARRFGDDDLDVVAGFADQVAVALGRARLVDELAAQKAALERANQRIRGLSLAQAKQIAALEAPRRKREGDPHPAFAAIVGSSPAMRRVLDVVERVADADVPLLVRGESGTGKELVARALHERSERRKAPFVAVNCGALPETLLEAELFGYVRGAFTGASRDKEGLFTSAEGGTLFLDEIGEMPEALQVKLLRVLQEREVMPLGATRPKKIDVRIVSATHRVLRDAITAGRFREDLFYRLAVVEVVLPPLRERMEDLPAIVQRIASRLGAKAGRPPPVITPFAMDQLLAAPWPGNVRELENALARAYYLADGGVIESFDLAPRVVPEPPRASFRPAPPVEAAAVPRGYKPSEATRMREVLVETGWNVSEAARKLGVPRVTMHRRMKRYGLVPPRR